MIVENINNSSTRPRILVAPLDWGLGHATRCIPIIKILLQHNADVVLAGSGSVVILLQQEFPFLKFIDLPGYKIKYSTKKKYFGLKILMQMPKIFAAIKYENNWLKKIIASENIDAVISDNRPGLSNKLIPCVYITHQLCIQTGNKILDNILGKIHYSFINKFNNCWVPDMPVYGLAGALSHPKIFPGIKTDYIGILSRFKKKEIAKKFDFLLLISGPEPQRSMFEQILLNAFKSSAFSIAIVRGLPGNDSFLKLNTDNIVVYNHLPAADLSALIQQSHIVIARSGYTTIMDLVTLQQKALLIPTPGQTEQEYLSSYLMENKMFYSMPQQGFTLNNVIDKMKSWEPAPHQTLPLFNEDVVIGWLQKLKVSLSRNK